jgi:phage-related protein
MCGTEQLLLQEVQSIRNFYHIFEFILKFIGRLWPAIAVKYYPRAIS